MTAIDLCCGAGGWACAAAGFDVDWLAVIDIDPIPLATWRANHAAQHPQCRVIRADLADPAATAQLVGMCPDIIVGGIPCEQVSQARAGAPLSTADLAAWHQLIDSTLAARLTPARQAAQCRRREDGGNGRGVGGCRALPLK